MTEAIIIIFFLLVYLYMAYRIDRIIQHAILETTWSKNNPGAELPFKEKFMIVLVSLTWPVSLIILMLRFGPSEDE